MDADKSPLENPRRSLICGSILSLLFALLPLYGCSTSQEGQEELNSEDQLTSDDEGFEGSEGEESSDGSKKAVAAEPPAPPDSVTAPSKQPEAVNKAPNGKKQPQPLKLGFNIGNYLYVHTDGAHVRNGAGLECRSVRVLKNNEKVQVLGRQGKWVRIGDNLWVSQKTLTASQAPYVVKPKTAYVHSAPYAKARIVAKFKQGKTVVVQGVQNAWAKIGSKRYILRRHLEPKKPL